MSRIPSIVPSTAMVTGANGFIGRTLCQALAHNGWKVAGVSRNPDYRSGTFGVSDHYLPLLSDADRWQQSLASIQCVIHLAARVHQMKATARSTNEYYDVNVAGSRFVAEQAVSAGVKRFVFLSSIKVNGEGAEARVYSADDVPKPSDSYGRSKMDAELTLREICLNSAMELVIIRPPLVYGPGVRANFRRLLNFAALGVPLPFLSIDNRRSLVSVWNLVDFIETTMMHPRASGETWLVSDGEDLATPDLLSRLARLMGKRPMLFAMPPAWLKGFAHVLGLAAEADKLCNSLQVDISPARSRLNWQPPLSVDEGLARTVVAFRSMLKNGT
jgi:nucleoside-diphosphate-sugar epimerase